jgi:NADP-dependent aldehyde dehydrogenase
MHIAAARPEPIPVYAEMSSVNPVFLMEHALADNAESLAKGFVDSLVLGVGQFCTNPGLAVGLEGDRFSRFAKAAAEEIAGRSAGTMLSPAIHAAYTRGVERLASCGQVETLARVEAVSGSKGAPALFAIAATDLLAKPELGEEIFGPSSLLVTCKSAEQMQQVAGQMEGQLTATLLAADADAEALRPLLRILERKVGRIVYNGYPTGVEVAWAMVHGGPFPATSDSRTTSVGGGAIERFLRPVSYQNLPPALLPEVLQDGNPLKVPRVVDRRAE